MYQIPLKRIVQDLYSKKMGGLFSKSLPKFSSEQFPELAKLFSREKTNRKINQTSGPMPDKSLVQDEEENNRDVFSNRQLKRHTTEENHPRGKF